MREKRGRVFRNNYKGHMDKTKRSGSRGGRWGWLGWGGKYRQLYLNNNKIIFFKKERKICQINSNLERYNYPQIQLRA